ncbi:signal recognition particle 9 kDa protein-domain-containing protein [Stachybotrys elegans]|uniref:Signal recognition particle 9 kDa protein-domain-containing protein n=1 Tax=Stachybotrys elegans TaxID=80388 RepID=A0A8K0WQ30_9HYPO|nr:signal recognition particle 9 kDa protein-domain-containing protein [Stachybotrys elegans]
MPYFKTSQEWLEQSVMLLEARPETTRVTTKYSIKPVKPRSKPARGEDTDGETTATSTDAGAPKPPRGSLVIKTYDPVSGVTLKYRTTKAAEVSRLIYASLGRLSRHMAAVPDLPELSEEAMPDAPPLETSKDAATAAAPSQPASQAQQGGGGGKKKKKGKK